MATTHETRQRADRPERRQRAEPAPSTATRRSPARSATSQHVVSMKSVYGSKRIVDEFTSFMESGSINLTLVSPSYNLSALMRLPKESEILGQCISAVVTNVVGHGWELAYVGPEGQEESAEAEAEKTSIESLLMMPNEEYTLDEMLEREKTDKETLGIGYLEAIRDNANRVVMMAHLPGHTMRMTEKEQDAVEVEVELVRDGKPVKQKVWRRFRRYVQRIGTRTVYFKEFGDPRVIDPKTGKVDDKLAIEDAATEVIVDAIYAPGEAYGLPRWLGQLPGVIGNRQADLTNLDYFKKNAIPALAVLVSGGQLNDKSMEAVDDEFKTVIGRDAQNRVVLLEAVGDNHAASADGAIPPPRIDIKPLAGERQQDGQFLAYKKDNREGVRSSFRLPGIFVGDGQDYTFATAKTSFEVAESQVFGPERRRTEALFQLRILASYGAKFWAFKLKPATISDPEEVVKALSAFDSMGALSPNLAIRMANTYFKLDIPKIEAEWGDWPFAIVKDLAIKGQLIGIEDIADIPDPLALAEASNPGAAGGPGGGKGGGAEDPIAPATTGAGGKSKGRSKAKPKPAPETEDKAQRVQRAVMSGVRRQLMALRQLTDEAA